MEKLKPCPFCDGEVFIGISDDEGNPKDESYESDPWSGLCYTLQHCYDESKDCPIATYEEEILGTRLYETREEAIKKWNKRREGK